jgi:hypothetical protein
MFAMTAAHPRMPLPSYARVRNPANGREVIVRVNDRGPFVPGRIIDLSYTAALKLGLLGGVAPVEVERLTFDRPLARRHPRAAAGAAKRRGRRCARRPRRSAGTGAAALACAQTAYRPPVTSSTRPWCRPRRRPAARRWPRPPRRTCRRAAWAPAAPAAGAVGLAAAGVDLGVDDAGPHRVHAHALGGHLARQAQREGVDRGLGRGVVDVLARRAQPRGGRRQVDDAPPAPPRRVLMRRTASRAHHIVPSTLMPTCAAAAGAAHLVHTLGDVDHAGVVHQAAQRPPKARVAARRRAPAPRSRGDVGLQHQAWRPRARTCRATACAAASSRV